MNIMMHLDEQKSMPTMVTNAPLDPGITRSPENSEKSIDVGPSIPASKSNAGNETVQNDVIEVEETSNARLSLARLAIVLASMWMGVFLTILDETMTATLLASISTSFNSFSNLSWITTTYLIGISVSQPLVGHLSDIFGRRICLIVSNMIFAIGSLLCGLSPSLPVLLLGRTIQGFGGGALGTIAAIVETDLVSLRNRALTEAAGGILYGVGLAAGGLFGGGINNAIGWKWAFLIQVPMMVVATIIIQITLPALQKPSVIPSMKRIDYVGLVSLLIAIIFLQIGVDSGGTTLPWTHPLVLTSLPLAFVAFIAFITWELFFASQPLIPLRQMWQRNIALSFVVYFFTFSSYFSNIYYMPIYLQVLGYDTTKSGLRFITLAVGAAIATSCAGLIIKKTGRYFYLNLVCQILLILGSGLLLDLNLRTTPSAPFIFLAILGLGFGGTWITTLMALLSSITDEQQAVMQSASYLVRCVGMVFGFAVSSAAFQKTLEVHLKGSSAVSNNTSITDFKPVGANDQDAYMHALHVVFYITFAQAIFAGLVSLLLKENELSEDLR